METRAKSGRSLGAGRTLVLAGAILALSFVLDRLGYSRLTIGDRSRLLAIESKDWYRLVRIAGYWPTWLVVGAAVALADLVSRRPNWPRRAVFLLLSTGAAGVLAEIIKPLVGRMRPEDVAGGLGFMPLAERWSRWSDLSMPSSHAAVAFAAAFAAGRMWPGCGAVVLLVGAGCGITRVLAGAHFVSDVVAGALVGWAATEAVRRLDARNNAGRPIGAAEP